MTTLENLRISKARLAARYAELVKEGLMDYSLDGQSVQNSSEARMIMENMAELNRLIQMEESPFELVTYGVV